MLVVENMLSMWFEKLLAMPVLVWSDPSIQQ